MMLRAADHFLYDEHQALVATVHRAAWRAGNDDVLADGALMHLRMGYRYGIPECCSFQFANDQVVGLKPQRLRGGVASPDGGGRYVPCWDCLGAR